MGRSKKPTAAEMKKIRLVKMIQEVTSSGSSKDTWNPAEISEGLKNINFIRRLVDTWNPAQLNEAIRRLGFKTIDTWNPAIIDEMKAALIRIFALHSVTGNPITLNLTGELPYLIKEATVIFSPKQSGTGDPSPTNIRPISGWDGLNLTRSGKNLVENNVNSSVVASFTITADTNKVLTLSGNNGTNLIAVYNFSTNSVSTQQNDSKKHVPNGTWVVPSICSNTGIRLQVLASNRTDLSDVVTIFTGNSGTFTIDDTYQYNWIRLFVNAGSYTNEKVYPMIIPSSVTDTSYEPYQGETYTAEFDETIMGGNYDFVSGDGSETWSYISSYNGETLPGVWISDRDVYAPNTNPSTGAEVAYQLATPTPIELTGQEVEPLPGVNVFSTDADTLNIKYQIDLS